MKKYLLASFLLCFVQCSFVRAQILCVQCFNQNDSISSGVHNLILNGGFENTNCVSNAYSSSFCPASNYYSCTVANWTCTGGGTASYVSIDDNTFTQVAEGTKAAYLGNGVSAAACTAWNDTSCLIPRNCETIGIPAGHPVTDATLGGLGGVSIEQTVSGLTSGNAYVLEFWAGGEPQSHGWTNPGLFAVDLGFGYTYLRDKATCPGCIGTTYLIIFKATSTSHTVKITNWGHVCATCTELIIDNIRLYTIDELSSSVSNCSTVINEADEIPVVTLYPNPSDGTFTVTTGAANQSLLEIFNTLEEKVYSSTINLKHQTLNPQLRPGIYFVKVGSGERVAVKKLVVE